MLVKATVLVAFVVGAIVAVPGSSALAAWSGAVVQIPGIPAGATASPGLEGGAPVGGGLDAVACTSGTRCVALGNDEIAGGVSSMFVDTLVSGSWTTKPIPGTLDKQRATGVSCSSTGNCLAVGTRVLGNIYPVGSTGFLIEESGGVWGSPVVLAAPGGDGSYVMSLSVSCALGASSCTIVGWEETAAGEGSSFSQRWTTGSGLGGVTVIPNPAGSNEMALRAVSCATATWCVAVGESQGSAVAVDDVAGTWGTPTSIPGWHAFYRPDGNLFSVSCASVGNCAAVGYFYFNVHYTSPMYAADMSNGTWGDPQALVATVPAPAMRLGYQAWNGPSSVSCVGGPMTCTVATLIGDSVRGSFGVTGQSSNGEWGELTRVPAPAPAGHRWAVTAVACVTSSACVGVGDEISRTYDRNEVFVPRAFTWQPAGTAPRPVTAVRLQLRHGVDVVAAWNAPRTGAPVARYKIWAVRGRQLMSAPVVTTVPQCTFVRLTPHTTYQVVVQALGPDGQASKPTTSGSVHTAFGVPAEVLLSTVTPGRGSISASWQEPFYDGGAPVTGYVVRVVGPRVHELVDVASPIQTRVVSGLVPGRAYAVRVAAVNRAGRGPFSRTLEARPT